MGNKRLKKIDHDKETMRLYRKANDFLMLKKEEISKAKDEDLFNIALDYEFANITKMICYFDILGESDNSALPIFYRMYIETIALKIIGSTKKLDKTNIQLFKIQANGRDIGSKERKKLAIKLHISEKAFSRVIKSNRPYYLIGAVNDYEHFRSIFIEACNIYLEDNSKEKEFLKRFYDFLGVEAHVASYTMLSSVSDSLEPILNKYIYTFGSNYKKDLSNIKQIKTPPLIIRESKDNNMKTIFDKLDILLDSYQNLFKDQLSRKKFMLQYFDEALSFSTKMIKVLIISYCNDIIYPLLPVLKVIFEKCGILYEALLGTRKERNRKATRYEYSFFNSFHRLGLGDNKDTDLRRYKSEITEFYNKGDKDLVNIGKDAYINHVGESPVYSVFLKDIPFNQIAENIIEIIDKENSDELLSAYYHGVENSHISGFTIFRDDDVYKADILYTIKFLIRYTENIFKLLKSVIRKEKIKTIDVDDIFEFTILENNFENSEIKTNVQKLEELESHLRILGNAFEKEFKEDIETLVNKTPKITKEEIEEIAKDTENN